MNFFTAPSQRFRALSDEDLRRMKEKKQQVLEARQKIDVYFKRISPLVQVRRCSHCSTLLLSLETDFVCCGRGTRQHHAWPKLPPDISGTNFAAYARVINCLLSPVVIHGSSGEGINYRQLSYQRSVMTVSGTLYNRTIRDHKNCWFLHDSEYDATLRKFLKTPLQVAVLHKFTALLQEKNSLFSPAVAAQALPPSTQVFLDMSEETRMCSVYVYDGRTDLAPSRNMILLSSGQHIDELSPAWEVLGYPTIHYTGNLRCAWYQGYTSLAGQQLSLLQYLRSVMLTQLGFWRYGRLAEQYVLDMWARQEQVNVRTWTSPLLQQKLRNYAIACGRQAPPGKVFLPSNIPGSYAYQRRFFHDVMHIARIKGNSHLFITFTCNINWPEIKRLLQDEPPDLRNDAHQAIIARVFTQKRKELIAKLQTSNYLFDGHLGTVWIVYSTEWQKGDLPHAHIACRLKIDTQRQPMATQSDQIRLMEKVVCAQMPENTSPHYNAVISFMQHSDPCKSCMREVRGTGIKRCRFRFPKHICNCARIDAKGFPIYVRRPGDERIVPYNADLLRDFNCHINTEWTFNSLHFAYLYSYMCKGVDTASFRIRDQLDEISAFRKARILTIAECVYRVMGFNVNYRDPPVAVCPIRLPRGREVARGENFAYADDFAPVVAGIDDFGDNEEAIATQFPPDFGISDEELRDMVATTVSFKHDYIEWYFSQQSDAPDENLITFCEYYGTYRFAKDHGWIPRDKPILARMPWYPPTAGEIYYLRTLLWTIPARSWADLYGGHKTFRDHCVELGLVPDGAEYLHGMHDAKLSGHSPKALRHLFALFIASIDAHQLGNIWSNNELRHYMASDFFDEEAYDSITFSEHLALMDIAEMVNGMSGGDVDDLFSKNGIPLPPRVSELPIMHDKITLQHSHVFNRYSAVVGYSIRQRVVVEEDQREINRFRETVQLLTEGEMQALEGKLNADQRAFYDEIVQSFDAHKRCIPGTPHLYSLNASGGCGKTFVLCALLHRIRLLNIVTIAVSSIGIGALLFDDGQTVHSMFRIPIQEETDILAGDRLSSTLLKALDDGKTSKRIQLLKTAEFIVWDEISPIRNTVFHAVDVLLRRVMNKDVPFGGKFVIFTGDWKQIPPVDEATERTRFWDGDPIAFESIFFLSVKSTDIYKNYMMKRGLTINERARHDPSFQEDLNKISTGVWKGEVDINVFGFKVFESVEDAMNWLFVDGESRPYDPRVVCRRAAMSPFNSEVDTLNQFAEDEYVKRYGEDVVTLRSVDEFVGGPPEEEEASPDDVRQALNAEAFRQERENLRFDAAEFERRQQREADDNDDDPFPSFDIQEAVGRVALDKETFNLEILHGMTFHGVPPHKVRLHRGQSVILLRNLDAKNRLQNGVRLIVKDFLPGNRLIAVTRADDEIKQLANIPVFLLPRIIFEGKVGNSRETIITRRQFPVRACAAVSIHKCQSMTLDKGLIDVRDGVFEHGQFFVAASRCQKREKVAFLARPGQRTVRNIVLNSFVDGS